MKKRVLIIDDTEFVQKTYKIKLLSDGYDVSVAKNGIEGLKAVSENRPDIILLDLIMPIMDGFKFLKTIREDPDSKEIPIVVFSSKGAHDEIEKALSLGATDYLIKAVTTPNKVSEKIRQVLS
ncbi:MAG: PleD family two-component system response regulator [Nitrospirota bacterium]